MSAIRRNWTSAGWPGRHVRGFTLVELLITIAIMAILLTVAVPSFQEATLSAKLSSYANALASSAKLARSEAIKRNAAVILCVSSNGTSCGTGGWQQGWIVLSGTTVIERQGPLAAGFKMTDGSGVVSLSFDATGVGATQANLKVCYSAGSTGSQERMLTINAMGKATIVKTTTAICS